MPCLPLSDYFLSGARGTSVNKILKNVTLACNPLRISYYGKEIVITRYNYFKKLKKNHLAKIQVQQEKVLNAEQEVSDSFKVAKTIVHQGTLIPLP